MINPVLKIVSISVSFIILLTVIELIRKEKLTFKYAISWMLVCVLGLLAGIFDQCLAYIAHFFGFELTSNFVFFVIIAILVFLSLMMTILLCQQDRRNKTIAQKIGILEHEIETIKKIANHDNS